MTLQTLDKLMKQTSRLSAEEQLLLASRLIERARQSLPAAKPQNKWRNLRGAASQAKLGEDAQVYITRSRAESDAHRDQTLGRIK
ncbi:MAG: hypothetical protein EHM81_03930 [Chloroflexi bacterium]|nr:MAG: hypothetical protein EHM81_03930 [Chloroflexota bacterium]